MFSGFIYSWPHTQQPRSQGLWAFSPPAKGPWERGSYPGHSRRTAQRTTWIALGTKLLFSKFNMAGARSWKSFGRSCGNCNYPRPGKHVWPPWEEKELVLVCYVLDITHSLRFKRNSTGFRRTSDADNWRTKRRQDTWGSEIHRPGSQGKLQVRLWNTIPLELYVFRRFPSTSMTWGFPSCVCAKGFDMINRRTKPVSCSPLEHFSNLSGFSYYYYLPLVSLS